MSKIAIYTNGLKNTLFTIPTNFCNFENNTCINTYFMNLSKRRRKHETRVHTDALNDILFILLFFFLIVATLANPNVVKLANAKSESDSREKQDVIVSIDAQNKMYVGSTQIQPDSLKSVLTEKLSQNPSEDIPIVVINTDSTIAIYHAIHVMRIARELNARTVLSVDKAK